jgi:hypothetical protein
MNLSSAGKRSCIWWIEQLNAGIFRVQLELESLTAEMHRGASLLSRLSHRPHRAANAPMGQRVVAAPMPPMTPLVDLRPQGFPKLLRTPAAPAHPCF